MWLHTFDGAVVEHSARVLITADDLGGGETASEVDDGQTGHLARIVALLGYT